jgi:predicted porin
MQKKIIALAVAGLASTAAFAQTNVTVYGVADAFVSYVNTNGGTRVTNAGDAITTNGNGRDKFGIDNGGLSGSRIGFKGTEDLGNGLKAIFVLEYALSLDQNTGIGAGTYGTANANNTGLQARQQLVGLSTKAGDVTLGRQYAPGYYTLSMDPLAASAALSVVDAAQSTAQAAIRAGSAARWNNSVNYKTANWGGFTAQATYAAGEYYNEVAMGESYGIGADYAAGPVAVKYVYQNTGISGGILNSSNGSAVYTGVPAGTSLATAANAAQQEQYIGASYDFKVVKLMASAQILDKGNKGGANITTTAGVSGPAQGASSQVYQIGAVVPVGKGNIHASYAYADLNSQGVNGTAYHGDYKGVAVAYTHGLSKRTTLYTGLRYQDVDSKGANNAGAGAVTTVFGAGINHSF